MYGSGKSIPDSICAFHSNIAGSFVRENDIVGEGADGGGVVVAVTSLVQPTCVLVVWCRMRKESLEKNEFSCPLLGYIMWKSTKETRNPP